MICLTCISESEDEVSSSKRMKYDNNVSFGCGMFFSNVLHVGHITACGHGVMCRVVWCVVWGWYVGVLEYMDMTHLSQPVTSCNCFVYRSQMKEFCNAFEK